MDFVLSSPKCTLSLNLQTNQAKLKNLYLDFLLLFLYSYVGKPDKYHRHCSRDSFDDFEQLIADWVYFGLFKVSNIKTLVINTEQVTPLMCLLLTFKTLDTLVLRLVFFILSFKYLITYWGSKHFIVTFYFYFLV